MLSKFLYTIFISLFFNLALIAQSTTNFVTTWKTDNPGDSSDTSITIPTHGFYTYNYDVDWNNDGVFDEFGITGDATHDFGTAGTYTIRINGAFPAIYFNNSGDKDKILSVDQWGNQQWETMLRAFYGCSNLSGMDSNPPDLSNVTSMESMFRNAVSFNEPIGNWDTSNITSLYNTFNGATAFNQAIGNWNTGNVEVMRGLFRGATSFNQNIEGWDTSKVYNMMEIFQNATSFNQNINSWNTSNVTLMQNAFDNAESFNQPLDQWDTGKVTNMKSMFANCDAFNQNINTWNTTNVTDMYAMFLRARIFNQPLNNWDTSNVTNMYIMFQSADKFNQPLDNWNTGNVTNMNGMFMYARDFNQNINAWNISSVTNMSSMFAEAINFNQPLNNWDTSSVTDIRVMFYKASSFNQPLDNWILSGVTNTSMMLQDAVSFNQDLSSWDMSNVKYLNQMLRGATNFDQDLSTWNIGNVLNANQFLLGVTLSTTNYDALLIGWQAQPHQPDVLFSGGYSTYCQGEDARTALIADGWTIYDGGLDSNCTPPLNTNDFATTWKTDNPGTSNNTSIIIPTFGSGYNYDVDWNNDGVFDEFGLTGNVTHDFGTAGTYTIRIQGDFPQIVFNNSGDKDKLLSVDQWGNQQWRSMDSAFYGCTNFTIQATDTPDLSVCTNMQYTFRNASSLNQNINNWDVSNITLMNGTFNGAGNFNQPLNNWDTSNVTTFNFMFNGAIAFNQDISAWNTSNVTNMYAMFKSCTNFNQPLNTWNTSNVTTIGEMFRDATNFNQNISSWNTSNVTDMSATFSGTNSFNQPLNTWDVSSVIEMNSMFSDSIFNQDISNWNTQNVTTMEYMFNFNLAFNQPIGNWNVANLENIAYMFYNTHFNQDLSNWNTSKISNMFRAFANSDFNQNIGSWNISSLTYADRMFENTTLSVVNYDALLIGWQGQPHNNDVQFGGGNSQYCQGENARTALIADGWIISDNGLDPSCNVPDCTQLSSPVNGATNVSVTTELTWDAVSDATGYYITIGTTNGGNDVLNNFDIGNVTTYSPTNNWLENTTYYVTITPYNTVGSATNCNETSFTTETLSTIPNCTSLNNPADGATTISITTNLTWDAISDATGYYISIGTSSGGNDVLNNFDIENVTTYSPTNNWLENTTYYVTITPYNAVGSATNCNETSFTTETLPTIPNCTSLNNPADGATNVSVTTELTWDAVSDATGYYITIGTSSGGNDVLDNFDIENSTTYSPTNDWQENTTYYVTITPYNAVGSAVNCNETSFTTETLIDISYMHFFTPNGNGENDFWHLIGNGVKSGEKIYIFNRYGKIMAILDPYGIGWDGNYQGQPMPASEYWFKVLLENGKVLKGSFALIR